MVTDGGECVGGAYIEQHGYGVTPTYRVLCLLEVRGESLTVQRRYLIHALQDTRITYGGEGEQTSQNLQHGPFSL